MTTFIHYLAALFLVGLPGILGSFWTSRDFGRRDPTTGILVLGYSVIMTGVLIFWFRGGYLPHLSGVAEKSLPVWAISVCLGTFAGLSRRHSPN